MADDYDDEYVAKLLAEDAKKSSTKYASIGLSALLPGKQTKGAPKPNTRFLTHLVKEANSHNAALKKKEELEARMRLKRIRHAEREDQSEARRDRKRHRSNGAHRRSKRQSSERRSVSPHDWYRGHNGPRDPDRTRPQSSVDRESRRERDTTHQHRSRKRSLSPAQRRRETPVSSTRHSRSMTFPDVSSDLDPLEEFIESQCSHAKDGAVKVRGRGAHKKPSTGIDERFSKDYDPALDVHLDSELDEDRDEWDQALEAVRDRAMWRKKQSERMKEAGFGDEDIARWERGGLDSNQDRDVDAVRWKNKGEDREWDAGKNAMSLGKTSSTSVSRFEDGWKRKTGGHLASFKKALG